MNNFSLAQACLGARSCLQACPVKGKCTVELGCYASIRQLLAVINKHFFQKLIKQNSMPVVVAGYCCEENSYEYTTGWAQIINAIKMLHLSC